MGGANGEYPERAAALVVRRRRLPAANRLRARWNLRQLPGQARRYDHRADKITLRFGPPVRFSEMQANRLSEQLWWLTPFISLPEPNGRGRSCPLLNDAPIRSIAFALTNPVQAYP